MRFASEGPMRGRRSSDSAGAISRSSGLAVIEGVEVIEEASTARCLASLALDDLDTLEDL